MRSIESINDLEVSELNSTWAQELQIELISGRDGLKRRIGVYQAKKTGSKLLDSKIKLKTGEVLIISKPWVLELNKLSNSKRKKVLSNLFSQNIACMIAQKGFSPGEKLIEACEKENIPLFKTKLPLKLLLRVLNKILLERTVPISTLHGVLLDIQGLGVLILGKSGIGKSENALDLINRGSKLISDDVVEIKKTDSGELFGSSPERIRHLMEIRGLGIINIKDLFGRASVMDKRKIDMVIELAQWNSDTEYDRLGIEEYNHTIMSVKLPYLLIPVRPGRNTATIIEVAALNQLLKLSGAHSTEKILDQLNNTKPAPDIE